MDFFHVWEKGEKGGGIEILHEKYCPPFPRGEKMTTRTRLDNQW